MRAVSPSRHDRSRSSRPWSAAVGIAITALQLAVFATRARAQSADSSTTATGGTTTTPVVAASAANPLAATTAPPWNPPHVIGASEPWEAVVRFPGRLVSLPLAALGEGTRRLLLAAEQDFYVARALYFFRGVPVPFSIGPAGLGDRTGFGAGVTLQPNLGRLHVRGLFDVSTLGYTRARLRLSVGSLMTEYRIDQRPAERFFGLGMNAHEDDESRYGLEQQRVVAGIDAASPLRGPSGRARERFAAWMGPRWSRLTQGFGSHEPSTAEVFPSFVDATLDRQIEHLTYGGRLEFDHRDGAPHWSRGWRASAEAERFDRPLESSPTRTGAQFTHYTYMAEGALSFWRDPRTLRLTVNVSDVELGSGADRFLVSDYSRLGGAAGLAGFEPHRFHDLDAINARLAYVFPISEHFDVDLHGDAGGTFASLQDDFRPNRLRQSAGFALRPRSPVGILASAGFDFSPEAARFVFSMGAER